MTKKYIYINPCSVKYHTITFARAENIINILYAVVLIVYNCITQIFMKINFNQSLLGSNTIGPQRNE